MTEIIALEEEIRDALPGLDAGAAMFDAAAPIHAAIRDAHDILCNSWRGPGARLDRLRSLAAEIRALA